jgi:hypothetical protein
MPPSLLRRMMAHPANERSLTVEEISVLASALADYQNACMADAKNVRRGVPSLYSLEARDRARLIWESRAALAHDLHNAILPLEGSCRVVIRS